MEKRGQMFLMAAVITIAILLGLGTLYARTRAPAEDITVRALAKEIKFELAQAIDYALANNKNTSDTIRNLSLLYAQAHKDKDIAVCYGNKYNYSMLYYKKGLLQTSSEGTCTLKNIITAYGTANIQLDGKYFYSSNFTKGQNIFVVVKKELEHDIIIATQ